MSASSARSVQSGGDVTAFIHSDISDHCHIKASLRRAHTLHLPIWSFILAPRTRRTLLFARDTLPLRNARHWKPAGEEQRYEAQRERREHRDAHTHKIARRERASGESEREVGREGDGGSARARGREGEGKGKRGMEGYFLSSSSTAASPPALRDLGAEDALRDPFSAANSSSTCSDGWSTVRNKGEVRRKVEAGARGQGNDGWRKVECVVQVRSQDAGFDESELWVLIEPGCSNGGSFGFR
eukprot:635247-Rhodomonas_salina.2